MRVTACVRLTFAYSLHQIPDVFEVALARAFSEKAEGSHLPINLGKKTNRQQSSGNQHTSVPLTGALFNALQGRGLDQFVLQTEQVVSSMLGMTQQALHELYQDNLLVPSPPRTEGAWTGVQLENADDRVPSLADIVTDTWLQNAPNVPNLPRMGPLNPATWKPEELAESIALLVNPIPVETATLLNHKAKEQKRQGVPDDKIEEELKAATKAFGDIRAQAVLPVLGRVDLTDDWHEHKVIAPLLDFPAFGPLNPAHQLGNLRLSLPIRAAKMNTPDQLNTTRAFQNMFQLRGSNPKRQLSSDTSDTKRQHGHLNLNQSKKNDESSNAENKYAKRTLSRLKSRSPQSAKRLLSADIKSNRKRNSGNNKAASRIHGSSMKTSSPNQASDNLDKRQLRTTSTRLTKKAPKSLNRSRTNPPVLLDDIMHELPDDIPKRRHLTEDDSQNLTDRIANMFTNTPFFRSVLHYLPKLDRRVFGMSFAPQRSMEKNSLPSTDSKEVLNFPTIFEGRRMYMKDVDLEMKDSGESIESQDI